MQRRDFLKTNLALLGAGLLAGIPLPKAIVGHKTFKKVILLGIDGLDYRIMCNLLYQGRLPNFAKLADLGGFSPLQTSTPPQSPVSWSCLGTGVGPDQHGLYDFIVREPNNYRPTLSITKQAEGNIFGGPNYILPLKAKPFWDNLVSAGIPATILRWPVTFPAQGKPGLRLLAGMGVPDIQGHLGRYTFYTEHPSPTDVHKDKVVTLHFQNQQASTVVKGPLVSGFTGTYPATIDLCVKKENRLVRLKFQGTELILKQGQFSKWVKFDFSLGFGKTITGIGCFCLVSLSPVKLYLSPVNIDPSDPAFPISYPANYSQNLVKELGEFATLGIPADTKALTEGRLDDENFLHFSLDLLKEQEQLFRYEFNNTKEGLLAGVIFTTDRIHHMFWAAQDPTHPLYSEKYHLRFGQVISEVYERMDRLVGDVLNATDPRQTLFVVFSDHGFNAYKYSVHVNSLLAKLDFLRLKKDQYPDDPDGGALFANVDWKRTSAYALGLNSLYVNLQGREGEGIVSESEYQPLLRKLSHALLEAKHPDNSKQIFARIIPTHNSQARTSKPFAPDLILGFRPGFRASWQTAIGGTPNGLVDINLKKWSGDHCIAPDFVPGILLVNQPLRKDFPTVYDLAPSIFAALGLKSHPKAVGSSFI